MITQEQAQNLKRGDTIFIDGSNNADGSPAMWMIIGAEEGKDGIGYPVIQTSEHGRALLTKDLFPRITLGPAYSQDEIYKEIIPVAVEAANMASPAPKKEKPARQPKQKKEKPAPAPEPAPEPEAPVDEPESAEPAQDNEPE